MGLMKRIGRQQFHDRYPALITSRAEPTTRLTQLRAEGSVVHHQDPLQHVVDIDEEAVAAAHAAELLERDGESLEDTLQKRLEHSVGMALGSYGFQLPTPKKFREEVLKALRADGQQIADEDVQVVITTDGAQVDVRARLVDQAQFFTMHWRLEP